MELEERARRGKSRENGNLERIGHYQKIYID
jgi:hypothetical protein